MDKIVLSIEFNNKMKAKHLFMLGASGSLLLSCSGVQNSADGFAHFTDEDKDLTVKAGDNFYQYSNGGWMQKHPIPDDKSRLMTFDILSDDNMDRLKGIVAGVCENRGAEGTAAQKVADLYECAMDTLQRNADGISALKPYLDQINAMQSPADIAATMAELHKAGISAGFAFFSNPDAKNSEWTIAAVYQDGIGMPDRDYYFMDDERSEGLRVAYKAMLARMFELAGIDNAAERADAVFAFETKLAEAMNTRMENRNPLTSYNKFDLNGFVEKCPNFDWATYFATMGAEVSDINIYQPKYFGAVGAMLTGGDMAVLKDYLSVAALRGYASHMSTDFENASFEFYGKTLGGSSAMRPLWRRSLGVVSGVLGEPLGQLFVEKYFPAEAKERMTVLIENLRVAFGQRIDSLVWMSDSTKAQAKEKLAAISVKVGYPDKWTDFSELTISKSAGLVGNLIAASKFATKLDLDKLYKPVDKDEWHMTPQTVNAYYSPLANEIVFPAGILQPPFFYANGDDAVNYGAIGVVIGHEMTHGFDDSGRNYDKDGNLKDWWTKEDADRFGEATKRLVDRYSAFIVVDSLHANGELTLGENIADLGGLNISYQAFRNAQAGVEPALVDGQTADQRFVYAYSRIWAGNIRKEYLYQQTQTDPHSTGRLRVNGQLPLVDFFYSAFDVKEGDEMYLPKEERIVIW